MSNLENKDSVAYVENYLQEYGIAWDDEPMRMEKEQLQARVALSDEQDEVAGVPNIELFTRVIAQAFSDVFTTAQEKPQPYEIKESFEWLSDPTSPDYIEVCEKANIEPSYLYRMFIQKTATEPMNIDPSTILNREELKELNKELMVYGQVCDMVREYFPHKVKGSLVHRKRFKHWYSIKKEYDNHFNEIDKSHLIDPLRVKSYGSIIYIDKREE